MKSRGWSIPSNIRPRSNQVQDMVNREPDEPCQINALNLDRKLLEVLDSSNPQRLCHGCSEPAGTITPMNAPSSRKTAALLAIGDELLSGRTRDANIQYLAQWLTERGIAFVEARIVGDEVEAIAPRSMPCARNTTTCSPAAASARPTMTSPPMRWRPRSGCRSSSIRRRWR